jgi:hypothetical protein
VLKTEERRISALFLYARQKKTGAAFRTLPLESVPCLANSDIAMRLITSQNPDLAGRRLSDLVR